jgi:pimeloyl-ACP methyl ester carboxylesterase
LWRAGGIGDESAAGLWAWALPSYAGAAVAERLRELMTPDGRTLALALWGDPGGFPILALHGTPGSRLNRWPREQLYSELGVCLVTHDRAGYGRSSRRRGRCIADEVDDVVLLADELGFDRFGVTGGSGGGPHALACAALLPERLVRASCLVGITPLGPAGLEREAWLEGMDAENVKEFGWAIAGEDVLFVELERELARIAATVKDNPAALFDGFELGESDRAALARPEHMQIIRESFAEQALAGAQGWVDDDLAHVRPWGFDLDRITVPVLIRYGASDVLVPAAHGAWLAAHVPGCVVKIDDEAGHLGADPEQEIAENVAWLRDGVPPPGKQLQLSARRP